MGGGSWSTSTYQAQQQHRQATGQATFAPRTQAKANAGLDPHGVALRESRDSDEHPTSLAIATLFDVTGSMQFVPETVQTKLPRLFNLLLEKGYVAHPQVLFGGIGDAVTDRIPFQVGQFESDNRIDENLRDIVLEGNGGGQKHESYGLGMYFMAHHTAIDCWEKRGQKGYLFVIGDELPYEQTTQAQIEQVLGQKVEADQNIQDIVRTLQQQYDVYFIHAGQSSYGLDREVGDTWKKLLPERVLELPDANDVAELIALTIGRAEGTIDLHTGAQHLAQTGASQTAIANVTAALSKVPVAAGAQNTGGPLPGMSGAH